MNSQQSSIGMIGLGLLGSAIATRLLDAKRTVVGYDLNAERRKVFLSIGGDAVEVDHFTLSYWSATTAVLKGQLILESLNDAVLVCTQAGTTGGSEPTVNDFEFVTDSTAIWYSLGI